MSLKEVLSGEDIASQKSKKLEQDKKPTVTSEYPDGGRAAWTTALGGWCCCFTSYGWMSSMGTFQTYYEQTLLNTYTPSEVSWIISGQVFCLSVFAPINGKIFDSYGCRGLLLVGSFMHVFGLIMLSLSEKYYQVFLAHSICSGIGTAAVFHAATNSIATWFLKKRGLAIGLVSSGASIGGVVVPILFDRTVASIGFGWSVRVIALIFLGLQLVAIFSIRSRLDHVPKPPNVREFLEPFREKLFVINAMGCFFVFWGILIPPNFISLSAQAAGVSPHLAGYLIPMVNGISLFGRILPLWYGDHVGRYNMAILFTIFGSVLVLGIWIPSGVHSEGPSIAFAALYGIPFGCFAAILPALVAQISPDITKIGIRIGSTFFVTAFAGLTGNPIAGALIGSGPEHGGWRYTYLKLFCGISLIIGSLFLIIARIIQGGRRLTAKA